MSQNRHDVFDKYFKIPEYDQHHDDWLKEQDSKSIKQ